MSPAKKVLFYCRECGNEMTKWAGQCPACKNWNTIVEAPDNYRSKKTSKGTVAVIRPTSERKSLSEVSTDEELRIDTKINELNRVLGGGIVRGSLVLVGGDPGIGKSTLLLQMCRELSGNDGSVMYVSGEESLRQIKLRADRIGSFSDTLKLLCETDIDEIVAQTEEMKPDVLVIDSIQTMCKADVESAAGSVSQVREITQVLLRLAKEKNIAVFIIGHVTKEGTVAGPRMLEHMVDTVLYFEGDNNSLYRILRAVKNRFGSTNEIGVFEMVQSGLREVPNPSEHMLAGMPENEPGSVVTSVMEGTRPILAEVQALVCQTNFNMPRRTAAGTDYNRVNLLMAVMEKHLGLHFSSCDAYINVAGGMRIVDPSLDLAIILALYSGFANIPLTKKTIVFGEVGLTGEVRSVSQIPARVSEAKKLGYERVILPEAGIGALKTAGIGFSGIELIGIQNIRELKKLMQG